MKSYEEREDQYIKLKDWLKSRVDNPKFSIQVNFFISGTSEHECITISGKEKFDIAYKSLVALEEKNKFFKEQQKK